MSKRPETPHSRERYHPWSTYIAAREEARRRGDRRVGTEHLLVALLENPGPSTCSPRSSSCRDPTRQPSCSPRSARDRTPSERATPMCKRVTPPAGAVRT
jgi:hypothetical protein